jgi:ribosomal protein L11 methylase PrmA
MAAVCADAPSAAVVASDGESHAASFRDPSGFVFVRDGVVYRQVQPAYREHYDRLVSSGLLRRLVDEGLLVDHEDCAVPPAAPGAYKILRPAPIDVISYPYEWSFGQLKDAALLTLRVQKRALGAGMVLKDATASNVQYQRSRPIFIDTLSFEAYAEGRPWSAYRQFCQHFLAPLSLMSGVDVRLGRLLGVHLDGVPLDLASRLLPRRTWLRPGLAMHIHAHAAAQRRYEGGSPNGSASSASVSRRGLIGLLESLERTIEKLQWHPAGTEWADYESTHRYSAASNDDKRQLVQGWFHALVPVPARVVDLGANTGVYSRLVAERGATVVSVDGDPAAVELNYRRSATEQAAPILPLLVDLTNLGTGGGWAGTERSPLFERIRADFALCLALVHHLAIGNNVPFDRIAAWLATVAPRLIIEFVPKHDEQVQRLLASRVDVFHEYGAPAFERAFARYFATERRQQLAASDRTLYQMRRL